MHLHMQIFSFVNTKNGYQVVEVELSLLRGLPKLELIGQADSLMKESVSKIKAAMRMQGFHFPKAQKILVNLRPNQNKKSSLGLDLAIVLGILLKTQQISSAFYRNKKIYIYGEINLAGEVFAPSDLSKILSLIPKDAVLVTGDFLLEDSLSVFSLRKLQDLKAPQLLIQTHKPRKMQAPLVPNFQISEDLKEILPAIALGEHSCLLAGPPGSGKSLHAQLIYHLMPDPEPHIFREIQNLHGSEQKWRPLVVPHSGVTHQTMVGGGSKSQAGELAKAHGGALILDEFLEFSKDTLEALREPMEKREIHVHRLQGETKYPAVFLWLATSNLCPCGKWTPKKRSTCTYSFSRCKSVLHKFSGPLRDRFTVLLWSDEWKNAERIAVRDLREMVLKARKFQASCGQSKRNTDWLYVELLPLCKDAVALQWHQLVASERRKLNVLRLAKSFADLRWSRAIEMQDFQKACHFALEAFQDLEMSKHPPSLRKEKAEAAGQDPPFLD